MRGDLVGEGGGGGEGEGRGQRPEGVETHFAGGWIRDDGVES